MKTYKEILEKTPANVVKWSDKMLKNWLKQNDTEDSVSRVFGMQIMQVKKEMKRRGLKL